MAVMDAGARILSPQCQTMAVLRRSLIAENFKFASAVVPLRIATVPYGVPLRNHRFRAECSLQEPVREKSALQKIGLLIEVEG